MDKNLLAGLGLVSAMSLYQLNAEQIMSIVASLSLLQVLTLTIRKSVFIDWIRPKGWRGRIPFYLIKCNKHGFQLSYPSGYNGTLICPKCVKEIS
jgi:hypothetical protein